MGAVVWVVRLPHISLITHNLIPQSQSRSMNTHKNRLSQNRWAQVSHVRAGQTACKYMLGRKWRADSQNKTGNTCWVSQRCHSSGLSPGSSDGVTYDRFDLATGHLTRASGVTFGPESSRGHKQQTEWSSSPHVCFTVTTIIQFYVALFIFVSFYSFYL